MNDRTVSTLGNVFTRKGGDEDHAANFQTKGTVRIPMVVGVHEDIMQCAETQGHFPAHNPGPCGRKR